MLFSEDRSHAGPMEIDEDSRKTDNKLLNSLWAVSAKAAAAKAASSTPSAQEAMTVTAEKSPFKLAHQIFQEKHKTSTQSHSASPKSQACGEESEEDENVSSKQSLASRFRRLGRYSPIGSSARTSAKRLLARSHPEEKALVASFPQEKVPFVLLFLG